VLLGADSETAWRWFVLVVSLLLDPAAVPLTTGGFVGEAVVNGAFHMS
jgi:hypothetical protein